jgi:hypothetical protein
MSHEIVMWIATLDNTKCLPTSNWCKAPNTWRPKEPAERFGVRANRNRVTRVYIA